MAPDRSRSPMSRSSWAPPGSPCAALTGAASTWAMTTLLPTRSASQRKHVSDLLAMVGDNTETMHVQTPLCPWTAELASWPGTRPRGWTWNHVVLDAPTKWWLSAASKVPSRWAPRAWWSPAGDRRGRVRASPSPLIVRSVPPDVRPSRRPLGRLICPVSVSGASPWTPPMTVWDACGVHEAVAGLPSCHTVHVIVMCAGMNDSTLRTAGDGRQRVPSPLPGWPHGQGRGV